MSKLAKTAAKLGVGRARRHVLLCTRDKCCGDAEAADAWKHLKRRLKELGRADVDVMRTRADCLGVCRSGPIAVVYPEGAWYRDASGANLDRIIDEHLIAGRIVDDLCFARGALSGEASPE